MVRSEREWVNARYTEADRKAEAARNRLETAHLGSKRQTIRERFEDWTVEAVKLELCDRYLRAVAGQLSMDRQQAIQPPRDFEWRNQTPVLDVVQRVITASDDEIVRGVVFRAK
ncbi:hypothetical protein [Streptomyces cucumeris]|uniref:hypothetical protein n=1 Tax=Streptomyces cucumeris TaxID=2962890 RepID=UPI0020C8FA9C|nr:hypothetical protein [Streptomyces sp. NEAU-Y11]MCP9209643.1 hypothetical protein [Streptomyces sp. NEAU-Y11]